MTFEFGTIHDVWDIEARADQAEAEELLPEPDELDDLEAELEMHRWLTPEYEENTE